MKRLVIRLAVLSVIVVSGLIAIAQARYGLTRGDEEAAAEAEAAASVEAEPGPIEVADAKPIEAAAQSTATGRSPLDVEGIPALPSRLGHNPSRSNEDSSRSASQALAERARAAIAANSTESQDAVAPPVEETSAGSRYPQGSSGVIPSRYETEAAERTHSVVVRPASQRGGGASMVVPTAPAVAQLQPEHGTQPSASEQPTSSGFSTQPIQPADNQLAQSSSANTIPTANALRSGGNGAQEERSPIATMPTQSMAPQGIPSQSMPEPSREPAQFTPRAMSAIPVASSATASPELPDSTPSGQGSYRDSPPPVNQNFAESANVGSPTIDQQAVAGPEGNGRPGSQDLEGAQTPSITVQKIAPPEIQVGKECTFEISVRNTGTVPAEEVEIHDLVPQGTRLVSTSPRAENASADLLIWKLGRLEPGQETKVEVRLMPVAEGEIGSVATAHFSSQASVRTRCTKPLLELRVSGPGQVMIGEAVHLNINISNPGSGATTGIVLMENVPEGLAHAAGESLEFEVGTLAPGESREIELTLDAEQAGVVLNQIIARADANLEAQDEVELEVIAPALAVNVDGPGMRYLERPATYTVSVANPGTASAQGIELTTYLPQGMKFVSANNSGHYDQSSHSVSWALEELPAKQAGSVELVAVPMEPGELAVRVEGKAQQGLEDRAEKALMVEGLAAIMFEVADLEDPIEVSGETQYEIRVVNQGSKAATNVQVAAAIPAGMRAVSADGPSQATVSDQQVTFAPLARLAPKADTTYTVNVQAVSPGDQRIRVQVMTTEIQQPVTKEESTRVYSDE